jgi:hypothetical protein
MFYYPPLPYRGRITKIYERIRKFRQKLQTTETGEITNITLSKLWYIELIKLGAYFIIIATILLSCSIYFSSSDSYTSNIIFVTFIIIGLIMLFPIGCCLCTRGETCHKYYNHQSTSPFQSNTQNPEKKILDIKLKSIIISFLNKDMHLIIDEYIDNPVNINQYDISLY